MKIFSTKPNQAELCSGVRFERVDGGMVSEDVSDEVGARFCSIAGFTAYGKDREAAEKAEAAALAKREAEAAAQAAEEAKKAEAEAAAQAAANAKADAEKKKQGKRS